MNDGSSTNIIGDPLYSKGAFHQASTRIGCDYFCRSFDPEGIRVRKNHQGPKACLIASHSSSLIRILEADGWFLARTRGSHRQFHHPAKPGTVTVAGHPGIDMPKGTLNSVWKQAGLN